MITLASDFGSPYPAAMRGVLCSRTDARLVDVAHDLPRGDIRAAAFWLRFVLPEFPPATHLVVVDPGVGTDRAALVLRAGGHVLVGPDNGVMLPAARTLAADATADAADPAVDCFRIDVADPASSTFHGRDVFAPAAADAHDASADRLGTVERFTPTDDYVEYHLPTATVSGDSATGQILAVDDFGNAITNVPGGVLDGCERVTVNGQPAPVGETFAAVAPGERLVTVGSHGNVECDVNQGRGDEAFDLAPGDEIRLERR